MKAKVQNTEVHTSETTVLKYQPVKLLVQMCEKCVKCEWLVLQQTCHTIKKVSKE